MGKIISNSEAASVLHLGYARFLFLLLNAKEPVLHSKIGYLQNLFCKMKNESCRIGFNVHHKKWS